MTITCGSRMKLEENEKIEKYQDLAHELEILWDIVKVIPIVIRVLGITHPIPRLLHGKLRVETIIPDL